MSETTLLILILFIGLFWFIIGSRSALNLKIQASSKMHSLPFYHGLYLALISVLPAILIVSALGVIDDYILFKGQQPSCKDEGDWRNEFELD